MQYLTSDRVQITYDLPLSEMVFDFYDHLKSLSRGYASMDYNFKEYRASKLVKLDKDEPVLCSDSGDVRLQA